MRETLETAVRPADRIELGSMLASIARDAVGLTDAEARHFDQIRDRAPAEPIGFE